MFCKNCGNRIPDNIKYCTNCGVEISSLNNTNSEIDKNTNTLPTPCLIAYIIFAIIIFINLLIGAFSLIIGREIILSMYVFSVLAIIFTPLLYIIGLVCMIIANVSYPKNKHTTIVLIFGIILGFILILEIISVTSLAGSCVREWRRIG